MSKKRVKYEVGSGNVYEDMGFKNPGEWSAKAKIASRIFDMIAERGLSQKAAAEIFGIAPGRVSDLRRGQFDKFSLEKLLSFLQAFDQEVEIVFHPKAGPRKKATETRISI